MKTLTAESILKYLDNKALLSDIYLRCDVGQIIGILGRNGSGKTTLLKIIYGTESSEQKFIRIDEQLLFRAGHPAKTLVFLPQDSHFPKYLTIQQLIRMYTQANSHRQVLNHELISKYLRSPFGDLSTGEQRIVEILLTLYHPAPFILMDEPFRGLSPVACEKVTKLIKSRSSQKGIIITDHHHSLLMELCHEVKLLVNGSLKTVRNQEDLRVGGYLPGTD